MLPWDQENGSHIYYPKQACKFEDNLTNLRKETGAASRREEEKYAGVRLLGLRQFVARSFLALQPCKSFEPTVSWSSILSWSKIDRPTRSSKMQVGLTPP